MPSPSKLPSPLEFSQRLSQRAKRIQAPAPVEALLPLFGSDSPSFDGSFSGLHRTELASGAWIDLRQQWLTGDHALFEALRSEVGWREQRRWMYEREVVVPRLVAGLEQDGPVSSRPPPLGSFSFGPLLLAMSGALSVRYGRDLSSLSFAYYRTGQDSVAMHGDRLGSRRNDAVVAVVSLGSPRRFLMKPAAKGNEPTPDARAHRHRSSCLSFNLGFGDLFVMGGTCQATWRHGVPKVARAGGRISVMFRET